MTRKKNKLLTFFWSLIPGAGEMYLGFFKMGISLMTLFVLFFSVSGFLHLYTLSLLAPVIWFYSFFHTNNLNSLPDDEFFSLEDDYIFHISSFRKNSSFFMEHRRFTAGCLIFFGGAVLWNSLDILIFSRLIPLLRLSQEAQQLIYSFGRAIPQIVIAIALIAAGVMLIRGKSKEMQGEVQEHNSSQEAAEKNRQ